MDVTPLSKVRKKPKKRKKRHFKEIIKRYCQVCGSTNILEGHHIDFKGMGGSSRDEIHGPDNAITLCRDCHNQAHGIKQPRLTKEQLREAKRKDEARGEDF